MNTGTFAPAASALAFGFVTTFALVVGCPRPEALADNTGRYDNPESNFPAIAELKLSSTGDLMRKLPDGARIMRRTDVADGFELRFDYVQRRNAGGGQSFQASTWVRVTYRQARG